ncbi:MAG: hypothetical protein ACLP05_05310 [Candidatus Kryptoniota bacterium]
MYLRKFFTLAAVLLMAGMASAQNMPKFSGLMFGDYYYNYQNDNQAMKTVNGFDYRRIYLTTDYNIADGFAARFRLESDPTASVLGNNKLSVMVKDAYVDWNALIPDGHAIFGLQGTPDINMAESIFGYRSLEKTIQDYNGISASRDLGVGVSEKFSDAFSGGVLIGNNSSNSQPTPTTNYKEKRGYLFLQFKPVNELTILLDGDYFSQAFLPLEQDGKTGDIIVNYANSDFSLGVQGFAQGIDHDYGSTTLSRDGISINGWVGLVENLRLVARFDSYDPNTAAHTSQATSVQNFALGALDWAVKSNVHLMPNIEYRHYSIGGVANDITLRGTVYFSF